MSKWKCGICNSEFDNYQAQGFNGIIYCPLCYFKELYKREKQEKEDYKSRCEKASEKLGNYKHYTIPTEEQNSENEDIVDSALNILQNGSEENEC